MKRQKGKTGGGIIVAIGLLILSKLKWVLALLKFTKFGGTFISMIISLGIYAMVFGWWAGVALIYLMFVHEMGHLVAAKQKGIKTSPAIFIPFLGAAIGMKEQPKDAATEAYLAYGGPLAGLISILPAVVLFYFTHQPIWALVILLGAFINLLNLLPASPLDGGRIVGVLSPHLWLLGLVGIALFAYYYTSPLLILIFVFGLFSWWRRLREDFSIKAIQAEMAVKSELIAKIETYQNDLFYTYYDQDAEDSPPVNEVMRSFIKRELSSRLANVVDSVREMSSWFFPFIQDKSKLEKRRRILLAHELEAWINRIDQVSDQQDLTEQLQGEQRAIWDLQQQIEKINKYYNASAKTRVVVFIAYILLAAVLGFFYLYGEHILQSFYFYDNPAPGAGNPFSRW